MYRIVYSLVISWLFTQSLVSMEFAHGVKLQDYSEQCVQKVDLNCKREQPDCLYANNKLYKNYLAQNPAYILMRHALFWGPLLPEELAGNKNNNQLLFTYQMLNFLETSTLNLFELAYADAQAPTLAAYPILKIRYQKVCDRVEKFDKKINANNGVYFAFLEKLQKKLHKNIANDLWQALLSNETVNWLRGMSCTDLSVGAAESRNCCQWSMDGSIVALDTNGNVTLLASDFKKTAATLHTYNSVDNCLLSPDNNICITVEKAREVTLICFYEQQCSKFVLRRVLKHTNAHCTAITLDNAGKSVAIATSDGTVEVIDIKSGIIKACFQRCGSTITRLCFNETDNFLACQSENCIYCCNIIAESFLKIITAYNFGECGFFGTTLIYANVNNYCTFFDAQKYITSVLDGIGRVKKVIFNAYANQLALVKEDNQKYIFIADSNGLFKPLNVMPLVAFENGVFSDNGRFLVSLHENGMLVLWDLYKNICIGSFKLPDLPKKIMFTPANEIIIQNSCNNLYKLNYFSSFLIEQLKSLTLVQALILNQCATMSAIGDLVNALRNVKFQRHYLKLPIPLQDWIEQLLNQKAP